MASITSVKFLKRPPSSPVAVLCFLGGVIAMFFGGAGIALGIFLVAVSFVVAKSARPKYSLLLNTSSGETKALESEDQFLIESVVSALNASIVYRG